MIRRNWMSFVAGLALLGFAQVRAHDGMEGKMGGTMAGGMHGMQCHHMGGMGGTNLVATSDGGVVMQCGNHLIKFDKNLKQISDVEVACPCCKKGEASEEGEMGMCPRHSMDGDKKSEEKPADGKKAEEKKPAADAKKAPAEAGKK